MREELREILYGGMYRADPGSDGYKEQDRRLDKVMDLIEQEYNEEEGEGGEKMGKKKKKPESFIDKMIKKDIVEGK